MGDPAARKKGLGLGFMAAAVGVLALLLLAGIAYTVIAYRRDYTTPSGEATTMLQSIRGAEEAYRAELGVYRACPANSDLSSPVAYYPRPISDLSRQKVPWLNDAHASAQCWRELGARADGPVRFSYAVAAGPAGPVDVPRPPGMRAEAWPFDGRRQSAEPYCVIVAMGQLPDGKIAAFVSSLDSEVVVVPIEP